MSVSAYFIGTVSGDRRIVVSGTATITLNDTSITGIGTGQPAILLNSGANLSLNINGNNALTAGGGAGIQAPTGTTLTIDGNGALSVQGGLSGAGIGGNISTAAGNITINGGNITATDGTITATGGSAGGTGIGVGNGLISLGTVGTISISGGSITVNGQAAKRLIQIT